MQPQERFEKTLSLNIKINNYCKKNNIPLEINNKPIQIPLQILNPVNKSGPIKHINSESWTLTNLPITITVLTENKDDGQWLRRLITESRPFISTFKGYFKLSKNSLIIVERGANKNETQKEWNNAIQNIDQETTAFIAILPYKNTELIHATVKHISFIS